MSDNYMLKDVVATLIATALFPLFMALPGYAMAWTFDVLGFRKADWLTKIAVALALSMGVVPIAVYLLAKLGGAALWTAIGAMWLWYILVHFRSMRARSEEATSQPSSLLRTFAIPASVLTVVGVISLVDLQVGDKLFPSTTFYDYIKNVAITDAISRTGVPPDNPNFYPGHGVPLFYYYFWFLVCSLVYQIAGTLVSVKGAVLGGTLWAGFAFFSILWLAIRYLSGCDEKERALLFGTACALLLVSGLDIIPAGLANAASASKNLLMPCASVDWWNTDTITGFTDTLLWVPQHVAALVACMLAAIFLREAEQTTTKDQYIYACLAALCLSSALGLSVYMAITFAVIFASWVIYSVIKGNKQILIVAGAAAIVALICSVPYLLELASTNQSHNTQLALSIRHLAILDILGPNLPSVAKVGLDLLFLPLYYLLELGFFAVAGLLYWKGTKPEQRQPFLVVAFIVSFVLATFVRSTVRNNDFGNRSMFVAQVVLLIWSAQVMLNVWRERGGTEKKAAIGLLALAAVGLCTTVYELILLRTYEFVSDGAYNYQVRDMYEAVNERVPKNALIAHNPNAPAYFFKADPFFGAVANRQLIASDKIYGTMFGIDAAGFDPVYDQVISLFEGNMDPQSIKPLGGEGANSRPIFLVAKKTDPIWNEKGSWVWTAQPTFANESVRVFALDELKNANK